MRPLKLAPLKEVIASEGLYAKKSLGQNFILDPSINRRIIRAAGDLSKATILEIGAGPGGLTRALLESEALKVIAIEKDERCLRILKSLESASKGRLTLIQADALTLKLQDLAEGSLKVIANLPYNIGTALLTQWLQDLTRIESLTLLFQKEVGLRLIAKTNTKSYGRLSVLAQWLCDVKILFTLPRSVFTPPPKITSALVHFIPKKAPEGGAALCNTLSLITQHAFGQRRKMLRSSLRALFSEEALKALHINPAQRAENLTIQDYVTLSQALLA